MRCECYHCKSRRAATSPTDSPSAPWPGIVEDYREVVRQRDLLLKDVGRYSAAQASAREHIAHLQACIATQEAAVLLAASQLHDRARLEIERDKARAALRRLLEDVADRSPLAMGAAQDAMRLLGLEVNMPSRVVGCELLCKAIP